MRNPNHAEASNQQTPFTPNSQNSILNGVRYTQCVNGSLLRASPARPHVRTERINYVPDDYFQQEGGPGIYTPVSPNEGAQGSDSSSQASYESKHSKPMPEKITLSNLAPTSAVLPVTPGASPSRAGRNASELEPIYDWYSTLNLANAHVPIPADDYRHDRDHDTSTGGYAADDTTLRRTESTPALNGGIPQSVLARSGSNGNLPVIRAGSIPLVKVTASSLNTRKGGPLSTISESIDGFSMPETSADDNESVQPYAYDPNATLESRMKNLLHLARNDAKNYDYEKALVAIRFIFDQMHLLADESCADIGERSMKLLEFISTKHLNAAYFCGEVYVQGIPNLASNLDNSRGLKILLSGQRKKDAECMYLASQLLENGGYLKQALHYVKKGAAL